jgi:hypothetical protein
MITDKASVTLLGRNQAANNYSEDMYFNKQLTETLKQLCFCLSFLL